MLPAARHPVGRQSPLSNFALRRFLHGVEMERDVVYEETTRLDEQPHDKAIAAVKAQEMGEIDFPGFRQARMLDHILPRKARSASQQTLDFGLFQGFVQGFVPQASSC